MVQTAAVAEGLPIVGDVEPTIGEVVDEVEEWVIDEIVDGMVFVEAMDEVEVVEFVHVEGMTTGEVVEKAAIPLISKVSQAEGKLCSL